MSTAQTPEQVLAEHRLTYWAVYGWKDDGFEVAPRCTCGVLWSAGFREDPLAQIAAWEKHLAVALRDAGIKSQDEQRAWSLEPEQIERVARAMYDVRDDPYDMGDWGELSSADRERWVCDARAGVEALWGESRG